MSISTLVLAAEELSDPESPEQLARLDAALCDARSNECDRACAEALMKVFERFPEADGFGVFWSVLHFLEAGTAYKAVLVESVRRAPSEFGLALVTRMINSGLRSVGTVELMPVVRWLATGESVNETVRQSALNFLRGVEANYAFKRTAGTGSRVS